MITELRAGGKHSRQDRHNGGQTKATGRLEHLPTTLGHCRAFMGTPPLGCSCMFYAHLSCLWLASGCSGKAERDDEDLFLLRGIRSLRRLAISSKPAGPESRTLTLFPHLSWSWIHRDRSASPGRAAPIPASSRLDCLSWMGVSSVYFLHLFCFKRLNLIFVSIERPLAERIFN